MVLTCRFIAILIAICCLQIIGVGVCRCQESDVEAESLIEEFRRLTCTYSNGRQAWEKAAEIDKLGQTRNDNLLRVRGLCRMAFMDARYNFDGNWKQQIELCEELCPTDDSLAYAELLTYRGFLATRVSRKIDIGAEDLNRAIRISIDNSYDKLAAIAFNFLALNSIQKLQFMRAIQEAYRGRAIAEHIGDDHTFRANTITLIRAFSITNQHDLSEKCAKELFDRNLRAYAADWILINSDDYEIVEAVRKRVDEIPEDASDLFDAGIKAYGNAKLCLRDDQYEKAMEYFRESIEYFRKSDDPIKAFMVDYERMLVQVRNGDPEVMPQKLEAIVENNHGREIDAVSGEQLILAFENIGDVNNALKWAKRVNESRKTLNVLEVEDAQRRAKSYWNSELVSRRQKTTIRNQEAASSRNFVASCVIGSLGFTLFGILLIRFCMMRQNRATLSRLVDERTVSLKSAQQRAELADEAKSDFLARINHELRNPLAAILGYCELLNQESIQGEKCRDYVRGVQASSTHLMELVGEVLEVTEIEDGQIQNLNQNFSLATVCEHVSRILEKSAAEKQIDFHCRLDPVCDPMVYGVETHLRQIIINLCSNAIKFTDEGCVHAALTTAPSQKGTEVVLTVEDTGIGIPKDDLANVFSPFFQSGNTGRSDGKGLGLYIVNRLTDHLDADIHIESKLLEGTKFEVRIPYEREQDPEYDVVDMKTSSERAPAPGKSMRILVVDDQEIVGNVVCGQIEALGWESKFAVLPEAAMELLNSWRPELVLLDLRMPGLDGFEVLEMMRTEFGANCPPVIAITGDATKEVIARIMSSGFDGYLTKPFRIEKLRTTIIQQLAFDAN